MRSSARQECDERGRLVASQLYHGAFTSGWTCYSYDARGRVTSEAVPAFGSQPARTATYLWAASNNPLVGSVTDPAGTIITQLGSSPDTPVNVVAEPHATSLPCLSSLLS